MKSKITLISLLLAAVVLLSACSSGNPFAPAPTATQVPVVVEAGVLNVEGRVVPKTYATLAFAVNGEIANIAVEEGQQVEAGTLLMGLGKREQLEAVLSTAKLEELAAQQALDTLNRKADLLGKQAQQALTEAEKAVVEAKQAVADLDTDSYRDTLDEKETAVQDAKDDLDDAQEEADKRKNLDPDNALRKNAEDKVEDMQEALDKAERERDLWKNDLDQALARLAEAEAKLADAQKEADNRAEGPDPDELALAEARLVQAGDAVKAAVLGLANMDLKAPFAGTVADLNGLAVGQWVSAGRPAVTLADFTEWYVETKDLNELDVVDASTGQEVVVRLDALPDVELSGVVTAIKPVYTERSGDVLYTVRVRLNETNEKLMWGMTAQVEFIE